MAQILVQNESSGKKLIPSKTYAELRRRVKETLLLSHQRIEREKVLTYWKTGKLIGQHIFAYTRSEKISKSSRALSRRTSSSSRKVLAQEARSAVVGASATTKNRADYGRRVIERLAEDLEISETVLRRSVQFAQRFPIPATRQELTWSHYRTLMTIPDPRKRLELADQADRLEWSTKALEAKVKRISEARLLRGHEKKPPLLTAPKLGSFYTYRIIDPKTVHSKHAHLLVDLGFVTYLEAERFEIPPGKKLASGDLATTVKDRSGIYSLRKAMRQDPEFLFAYQAYVERVIDGDTLKVQIDLGFGILTRQVIRLRGIDAPEMDTQAGKAAKEFVIRELEKEPYVTIKSTRSDKYDRYLADIFYKGSLYLNQRLLDEGHAALA